MKVLSTAIAALVMMAGTAMADPVSGTWQTETGDTGGYLHVKLAPCGGAICGTIARVVNNPNQDIVGRKMIWDMAANGGGKYSGGKIWAPDVDKTYRSKMALSGNTLKVSGCVGPICRSQSWKRIK